MAKQTYDLIVVGAGVVGTFHAYFAAKAGAKVLLLERNPAPNEATVRNFGMVATTTIAAGGEWDQYASATSEIYHQLEAEIEGDLTLRHKGSLYLVETEAEVQLIREFAAIAPSLGKRAEFLDSKAVLAAYPFADPEYVEGGLLLPNDMSVDPRQFIHRVHKHIRKTELLHYQPGTAIVKAAHTASHCVLTDSQGELYTSEKAIICNGVEYRMLFPELFRQSPLQISKLQMMQTVPQASVRLPHNIMSGLTLRRYPAFAACPSYKSFIKTPFEESYRKWGIHLLFKQADDGSVIIGDSHVYFALNAGDTVRFDVEQEINDAILTYGKRMLHLDSWQMKRSWNGYYMSHPTAHIFSKQISDNLRIATGIGGKGMSTGAGFAKANIEAWFEGRRVREQESV